MNSFPRRAAGLPGHCPLCTASLVLKLDADAEWLCCPVCGYRIEGASLLLAFWERERTAVALSLSAPVTLETRLSELEYESLTLVELVMLLEGNVDVVGSEVDYEALNQAQTVGELLGRLSHLVATREA